MFDDLSFHLLDMRNDKKSMQNDNVSTIRGAFWTDNENLGVQPVLLSVGITQKCLNSFSQSVISHHLQKLLFGDFSVAVVVGESNHLLGKRRRGLLQ